MTENIADIVTKHTYGTWRAQRGWKPMVVTGAEGCWFWDDHGNRYLDMAGQLMCSNLGHQNKAVVDAICAQARKLSFIAPGYATEIRAELALRLLDVVPKGIEKFFFATSGTEANEAAIKIARLYTGKHKIIARYTSYHGSTAGSVSLTGDYRRWAIEPTHGTVDGVIHAPDCHPYRLSQGGRWGVGDVEYFDYVLENEGNVAAILIEPVPGTNGILVPPDGYLQRLQEIARKHKVLLIADEVMSGWGRTGKWFSVEHWNVQPDILVTAKGVTSAMAPLGVVGTTRAIADHFEDNAFAHGHTYESHPLTLAPAVAAIDEYKRLGLIDRARAMGEVLGSKLRALKERHPSVGDVRGLGLFWAIDLVKNRETKEPFNTMLEKSQRKPLVVDAVVAELLKRKVTAVGWVSHIVLAPPLIITEEELDIAIAALDEALLVADAKVVE